MIPKHYDPDGRAIVLFSIDNEKGVHAFTGKNPSEFEIIDDPLLKKAYAVPCEIDYKISKEDDF